MRNPSWTRDELILALDYYVQHPGESHSSRVSGVEALAEDISRVARALGHEGSETLRNANGVAMKLLNLRAHDPAYTAQGKKGLTRGNKLEATLWLEFAGKENYLGQVAEGIRNHPLSALKTTEPVERDDISEALEGQIVTKLHRARERSKRIVQKKKEQFAKLNGGRVFCEACGLDYSVKYGERGIGYIECHHLRPLSLLRDATPTKLDDLALLCASCHRMVHVSTPWLTLEEITRIVEDNCG